MRDAIMDRWPELRYEPTEKRIRVMLGDDVLVDTTRALLVWEPRRIVPSYAVPLADLRGELTPDAETSMDADRLLHPGIPFAVHSAPGDSFTVRTGSGERTAAAFRPADPDLDGYAILDFKAFDRWLEEDDPLVSHARDPFHRIDVRPSSRHVRIELNGELLAREHPAQPALRDPPADPVLPSARGHRRQLTAQRQAHLLRVQRRGELLVSRQSVEPGLDLPQSAARRGADHRAGRIL